MSTKPTKPTKPTNKSHASFETSLNTLEQLIQKMESGDLSLEESLKSFEEGVKLTKICQQALSKAEQKVQLLLEQNGELVSQPFEPLPEGK